jgi:hypothetical protein
MNNYAHPMKAAWTDRDIFPCSRHAFGVREAVELARAMNRLPRSLMIYGIEGRQFSFGAPFSQEVELSIEFGGAATP